MSSVAGGGAGQVLALLDDAVSAGALLQLSVQLARALQRELSLVYVESAPSLLAAAMPFAKVLAPSGDTWLPLHPQDVERGFRIQAARLRALAARVALPDAVQWSMRIMRGSVLRAAVDLRGEADLMLLPGTMLSVARRVPQVRRPQPGSHRAIVRVLDDGSEAARRAEQIGALLARALGGSLQVETRWPTATDPAGSRVAPQVELLILPHQTATAALLALQRGPVLLVD